MEWICKTFDELTPDELYDILRLREAVFVLEQNCLYEDIDGIDRGSLHLFCRGVGLGGELLRRSIDVAFARLQMKEIYIEAQQYAEGFYAREGFVKCSEPFLEDGILHVQMRLKALDRRNT